MVTQTGRITRRLKNLATLPWRSTPDVGGTPADIIHHENKWRLLRYRPRPEGIVHPTPILCVPSLINRHYVLDLVPGKSFVEYLIDQGHDVYMIDWGRPGDEDRYLTFDDICDRYLGRAIRKVAARAPQDKVHVLGYCLGGTLAAIHAARHQEHIASLIALAAPVSFGGETSGILGAWTQIEAFDLDTIVEATGNVPWPLMQAAFHMIRPTMNLSKAHYMIDRAWDDAFLDGFFALETWGHDNVSFPGACYKRYIQELYRDDLLIKGEFRLGGEPARLESITCPVMAICFYHDTIVPLASAEPLIEAVSSEDTKLLKMSGGHVGAVVSRKASGGLWPAISEWAAARE